MNRIRSFEKQIDSVSSYQYYYSPQNSHSTTDSSSFYSHSSRKKRPHSPITPPPPQQISPLTLENLSKVELADPASMPLARYCSEMEAAPFIPAYSESTISITRKSQHRRVQQQQQEDTVLESPRILPFPYHNDSYFLPTAEHDYPGGCSTTDASSSMISLSIHTMGSRQQLTSPPSSYHPNRGYQRQLLLSSRSTQHEYHPRRYDDDDTMSNLSHKRRAASVTPSSPSTLRDETTVPQKKRRSNNKFASRFKQNLLRFKSSNSTILESGIPQPSVTAKTRSPSVNNQYKESPSSSWYEKLWKFLRPQPFVKKSPSKATTSAPVWYSQFRCNPPPPSGINLLS
jgi:hypothetical protein